MIEIHEIQKGITYRGASNPTRHVLDLRMNRMGKPSKRVILVDRQTDIEYVFMDEYGNIVGEPRVCMASTFAQWAIEPLK
jgi:hypothetical protein